MNVVFRGGRDADAAAAAYAAGPNRPRLVLATCMLASSLAFIDGFVVNVGLPAIGQSLAADTGALPWVVNAYLLPLSALLLLGGAAGDRFGRRRMLMAGTMLFALGSLACAVAPDLTVLLAGRAIQGCGAAMLMPNSLAILSQTFSGPARARAVGIWAAAGAASGAVAPLLGGWLVDVGSWRAIFLLNLPVAAAAVFLAGRCVPADARRGGPALDWLGGALATVALGASTWALTVGSSGSGWKGGAVFAAATAACAFFLFVVVEKQRGARAMMPLSLFASRSFIGLTLLTFFLYGALGGLFVLLPYVLIRAGNYSATGAGAALLPMPLILAVASPLAGALAGRVGTRLPLAAGPMIAATGFLLATRIDAGANYWAVVLPAIAIVAFGAAGAVAPLTTAVLGSVDARFTGAASGFNSAVARTGGLIATALAGVVFAATGDRLVAGFHAAMVVGVLSCLIASAGALILAER